MGRIKISFNEDVRNIKKGTSFELDRFPTLFVGKNGSGKSTVFHALRGLKNDLREQTLEASEFKLISLSIDVEHDYDKIFYYDSVKDSGTNFLNSCTASNYISSGGFASRDLSHGQSQLIQFDIFLKKIKPLLSPGKTLLVLDELDDGFDLKLMSSYYGILKNISSKYEVDVIAITHNPIAMTQAREVYSIESNKYVSSKFYVGLTANIEIITYD